MSTLFATNLVYKDENKEGAPKFEEVLMPIFKKINPGLSEIILICNRKDKGYKAVLLFESDYQAQEFMVDYRQ